MSVVKILKYALQREKEGYQFFKSNAAKASHAAAAGIFQRLADEELKHIEFINGLLKKPDEEQAVNAVVLEADGWFEDRAEKEMLDQSLIEAMTPDIAVLRTAYLIERDFAEFYEQAAQRVEDEAAQKSLSMLARWERGHEKLFKEMHDKAFEMYAGMPWGG